MEILQDSLRLKRRSRVTFDGAKRYEVKTLDAEPIIDSVAYLSELQKAAPAKNGMRYVGSIDPHTAANWAKECGCAIGTKEWVAYARRKLKSPEFSRFSAEDVRKYV